MISYDSFEVGAEIGRRSMTLDAALVADWIKLFPEDAPGEVMPPGMMAVVVMRAYSQILAARPPGNVHAAQRFEILRLPAVDECLITVLFCAGKEVRKGRNWVHFMTETTCADALCFRGRQTILWAA